MKKTILFFVLTLLSVFAYAEPCRRLTGKDPEGHTLELDDGSVWKVHQNSLPRSKNFYKEGDLIVIYPVILRFLSDSMFFFHNKNSGQNVNVDLSLGPISGRPGCVEIEEIDFYQGVLLLRDGYNNRLTWQVNSDSLTQLRQWKPGQAVILGSNRRHANIFGSPYEFSLINVEKIEIIQANRI
jgi:hypothetical protein